MSVSEKFEERLGMESAEFVDTPSHQEHPSFEEYAAWKGDLEAWTAEKVEGRIAEYEHKIAGFEAAGIDGHHLKSAKDRQSALRARLEVVQRFDELKKRIASEDVSVSVNALGCSKTEINAVLETLKTWLEFSRANGMPYNEADARKIWDEFAEMSAESDKQLENLINGARGAVGDLWQMRANLNDLLFGENSRWKVPRGEKTLEHRAKMRDVCERKMKYLLSIAGHAADRSEYDSWREEFEEAMDTRKEIVTLQILYWTRQKGVLAEKLKGLEEERTRLDRRVMRGSKRVSFFSFEKIDDRVNQIDADISKIQHFLEIVDTRINPLESDRRQGFRFPRFSENSEKVELVEFPVFKERVLPNIVSKNDSVPSDGNGGEVAPQLSEDQERVKTLRLKTDTLMRRVDEVTKGFDEDVASRLKQTYSSEGTGSSLESRRNLVATLSAAQNFIVTYYKEAVSSGRKVTPAEVEALKELDEGVRKSYFDKLTFDDYGTALDYVESVLLGSGSGAGTYERLTEDQRGHFNDSVKVLLDEVASYKKHAPIETSQDETTLTAYTARVTQIARYLKWREVLPQVDREVNEIVNLERRLTEQNAGEILPAIEQMYASLKKNLNSFRSSLRYVKGLPGVFAKYEGFIKAADNYDFTVIDKAHTFHTLKASILRAKDELGRITSDSDQDLDKKIKLLDKVGAVSSLLKTNNLQEEESKQLEAMINQIFKISPQRDIEYYAALSMARNNFANDYMRAESILKEVGIYLKFYPETQGGQQRVELQKLFDQVSKEIDLPRYRSEILEKIEEAKQAQKKVIKSSIGKPYNLIKAEKALITLAANARKSLRLFKEIPAHLADLPRLLEIVSSKRYSALDPSHKPYELIANIAHQTSELKCNQLSLADRFDVRKDLMKSLTEASRSVELSEHSKNVPVETKRLKEELEFYFSQSTPEDYEDEIRRACYEYNEFVQNGVSVLNGERIEFKILGQLRDGLKKLAQELDLYATYTDHPETADLIKNMAEVTKRIAEIENFIANGIPHETYKLKWRGAYPSKRFGQYDIRQLIDREEDYRKKIVTMVSNLTWHDKKDEMKKKMQTQVDYRPRQDLASGSLVGIEMSDDTFDRAVNLAETDLGTPPPPSSVDPAMADTVSVFSETATHSPPQINLRSAAQPSISTPQPMRRPDLENLEKQNDDYSISSLLQ